MRRGDVAGDWKGTCRTGSIFTRWETLKNIFRIMRMIQLRGRKLRRREKKVRSLEGRKGEIQRSSGRSEEQEHFVLDNEREGRRCEYVFGQVGQYSRFNTRTFLPDYFCVPSIYEGGSSARVEW